MRIALQKAAQSVARKFGFEVRRAAPSALYQPQPNGYSTFAPWIELDGRYDTSASPLDHIYYLQSLLKSALVAPGDVAEFGVWRGGSARALLDAMPNEQRALHLFDTFDGMPDEANEDASPHCAGDFGETSIDAVRQFLADDRAVFHKGILPQSLDGFTGRVAFAHFDLDLYECTLESLNIVYPLMPPRGIILFDDYGLPAYAESEKRAADEFFRDKPENLIVLASGQAFAVKR